MFFCRPLSSPCSRRVVGSVVRQNAGTRVAPVQQARCFEAKISHEERAHLLQKISPDLRKVLETGSDADLTRYIRNMSPEEVSHLLDDPVYKKKQEEWQRLREVDRVSNLTDSELLDSAWKGFGGGEEEGEGEGDHPFSNYWDWSRLNDPNFRPDLLKDAEGTKFKEYKD